MIPSWHPEFSEKFDWYLIVYCGAMVIHLKKENKEFEKKKKNENKKKEKEREILKIKRVKVWEVKEKQRIQRNLEKGILAWEVMNDLIWSVL